MSRYLASIQSQMETHCVCVGGAGRPTGFFLCHSVHISPIPPFSNEENVFSKSKLGAGIGTKTGYPDGAQ